MLWLGSKPVRRSLNLGLESDPHVFLTSLLDVLPGDVDVFQLSTHTFRFVCFLLNSFILYIGARSALMAIDRGLVSLSLFLVLVGPQVAYETNAAAAYNGGWEGG